MEASITLWKCPPLRARISPRQCSLNRARAMNSRHGGLAFDDLAHGPLQCLGCPGLEWWADETGERPRSIATQELLREHVEKDAQRRRLGELRRQPPAADRCEPTRTDSFVAGREAANGRPLS